MYSKEEASRLVKNNFGSLEKLCKEAVCTADYNLMRAIGFPELISERICDKIKEVAKEFGITNLSKHYETSVTKGKSNIINLAIRRNHKVYFASRATLHPLRTLTHFETKQNDITSILFHRALKNEG